MIPAFLRGHRWPSLSTSYQQEYYFLNLYRLLLVVLAGAIVVFSHLNPDTLTLRYPTLAALTAGVYAAGGVMLLLISHRSYTISSFWVGAGVVLDIVMVALMAHSIGSMQTPVLMLLLVTLGSAGLLLQWGWGLFCLLLALAALGVGWFAERSMTGMQAADRLPELLVLTVAYVAAGVIGYLMNRQLMATERLVRKRGEQLEDLTLLNELIIRRMRTGVLAVDESGRIVLMNEAAWNALGQPASSQRMLPDIVPKLYERLQHWQEGGADDSSAMALFPEQTEVVPRFAKVSSPGKSSLIFLDDSLLVSQRAEAMTLTNMGRLSASIAHEIRNPLSAISHAAQLLEEAKYLHDEDQQLVDIMLSQSQRVNQIIENILSMSRRERSRPERLELNGFVQTLVHEYNRDLLLAEGQLTAQPADQDVYAMVDASQLHQVISNLINNALRYGRHGDDKAVITVAVKRARHDEGLPQVEVLDHGPGIPENVASNIFEPFYTTHQDGSGLGLYLASQLCEGNQASLEYEARDGGGSCFRITLAPTFLGQMYLHDWTEDDFDLPSYE